MEKNIVVLPGDGIGQEIMDASIQVLTKVAEKFNHKFNFEQYEIGGTSYEKDGEPLTDETVNACLKADAILLGAIGGPKWDSLPPHLRPEQGLLKIRKALNLYANIRPIKGFEPLLHASPLKESVIKGSDIYIVRELTGGLYFGTPRERREDGNVAVDTLLYHRNEIERIVEKGFESARIRNKHLTSVDKANVLESSRLWREIVEEKRKDYPDVKVDHMLVDSAAMKLITDPTSFDVIVTENLFGDILSDEGSVLTGSIGMLPSASLSETIGLYEPVHGSAPDIAGKGIANPLGMILSSAMMLRYSFDLNEEATAIEKAVEESLEQGIHTADLKIHHGKEVGTKEMTETVISNL
ncbi:3-isopropylmalate dehydrogenase [Pseudogracilibacillus auburnensis]|uniref:3-isopropylmalate dehydrogenase n=1 Tax=Pseudogracilibacillus auburnensis TaxID=1494959 RepID=A0A2V3W2M0_9BACI|nr:3-isopropylmalate dehydrogenase [Pseudogracilibacillus auburnensis]MBO1002044.1 3-isopropylmalate dehydrogenase [Pseudogracilibacillus auburnensis]PXW87368.1 3-isopropylmalate dehydrogenase [Pseudogracilibacillus auburnensis]